jgi:hypothetical protein
MLAVAAVLVSVALGGGALLIRYLWLSLAGQ